MIPYAGLLTYTVGRKQSLFDSNQILFAGPNRHSVFDHPLPDVGYSALIITPAAHILEELCEAKGVSVARMFDSVARPADMRTRLLIHHLRALAAPADNPLEVDEWVILTLSGAVGIAPEVRQRASDLVNRAKEVLHAKGSERLCLEEIAQELGVTPVYLTQEFSRSTGTPLYRYQLQLRLSRALLDLPTCEDITGLGLDLGFSSHSHFSAAFRKTFGMTPSQYRSSVGSNASGSMMTAFLERWRAQSGQACRLSTPWPKERGGPAKDPPRIAAYARFRT